MRPCFNHSRLSYPWACGEYNAHFVRPVVEFHKELRLQSYLELGRVTRPTDELLVLQLKTSLKVLISHSTLRDTTPDVHCKACV